VADTVGAALVASDGTIGEPVSSLAAPGEEVREKRQFIGKELPEKLRWALLKIIADFMSQTQISRREYVKKCIRNHELFRGNAWGWYDYATGSYRRDFTSVAAGRNGSEQAQLVQSLYQLNVFQPFALSVIALLSSNKMTVKHWPENSHKPEDIEAARKHDLVYRAFQRSERHHAQLVKAIYHLWCDGTFGSYIRTVFDGDRFGYKDEPIVEHRPREIGPPSWKCVICGAPAEEPGFCVNPECGAPLPEGPNVPAPIAELPVVVGSEQIPRGRTVRDIVGGLELLLPPTCEELWEFPYLIRRRIVPKSTVRAAYPEMWRDIGSRGDGADDSVTISLERRAQLQATLGTSVDNRALPAQMMDHVFYAETWLRRTAFYQEEDEEIRDQLLDMFPDGLCVVTADDLFLEARAERMDDHWRICHALPGKGQIREPIGGSLVQIQEIINDLVNIIRDTIEFTLPMTFVDQGVFDIRKLGRSANAAGMMYNATKQGGRPIGEGFFQTQPGQVSQYAVQFLNDLRTTWAQFASGAFPAAYGGGTPGNSALDVDTPIPTPSGFVRNGDLAAGDKVFGEDGRIYDVVKAHPIYYGECYRVTFDDGSSVVADGKHRWFTASAKERERLCNHSEKKREQVRGGPKRSNTGPKPTDVASGSIKTTAEIAGSLLDRRGRANHAIPVAKPFDAEPANLPIDPYVLGVWLGDGMSAHGGIAASDDDGPHMAEQFAAAGYELRKLKTRHVWYAQRLRKDLRKANLLNNKHIPTEYLWASREQRLALLQGLMDTDGCATTEGKQFFCNRNKNLVDGVYHLAASLGAKPRIVEMTTGPVVDRKTGRVYEGGRPIWNVRWSAPLRAFRMRRKAERVRENGAAGRYRYRYIISAEPVESRPVRCITVSNPTELYQFGRNFGVTANTAAGIEVERNSALGRISLYLRCLTEHWAQCAPLVIKDYRENGTEPLTVVDKAPSGDYKTDSVTPEDIEIGSAKTMPELDEEYPVTWPQRQAALLQMFANPMYQGMLALISNAGEIKRTLGHDLKVPGEDAYEFQHKLIKRLLEEAPLPGPPQPVMMPQDPNALVPDPATGQMVPAPPQQAVDEFGQPMMQPGPPVPSIQPQQIEDHLSMLQACIDFYYSEEGQARGKNPDDPGWQNFMLHAAQRQAAALEQVQTMPPMQPGTPPIPAQVMSAQPPQVPPPMDPSMMGLPLDQTGGMPPMPT
jgi:hypothetical protein